MYSTITNNNAQGQKPAIKWGDAVEFAGGKTLAIRNGDNAVINADMTVTVTSKDKKTIKCYDKNGNLYSTIANNNSSGKPNIKWGDAVEFEGGKTMPVRNGDTAVINSNKNVVVTSKDGKTKKCYDENGNLYSTIDVNERKNHEEEYKNIISTVKSLLGISLPTEFISTDILDVKYNEKTGNISSFKYKGDTYTVKESLNDMSKWERDHFHAEAESGWLVEIKSPNGALQYALTEMLNGNEQSRFMKYSEEKTTPEGDKFRTNSFTCMGNDKVNTAYCMLESHNGWLPTTDTKLHGVSKDISKIQTYGPKNKFVTITVNGKNYTCRKGDIFDDHDFKFIEDFTINYNENGTIKTITYKEDGIIKTVKYSYSTDENGNKIQTEESPDNNGKNIYYTFDSSGNYLKTTIVEYLEDGTIEQTEQMANPNHVSDRTITTFDINGNKKETKKVEYNNDNDNITQTVWKGNSKNYTIYNYNLFWTRKDSTIVEYLDDGTIKHTVHNGNSKNYTVYIYESDEKTLKKTTTVEYLKDGTIKQTEWAENSNYKTVITFSSNWGEKLSVETIPTN